MNLIERLGGYEKAKEIAFDPLHPQMTHVSNDGRHWVNENFSYIPEIQSQIPKMVRIDDIRKALLEYRRQHSIFESEDKIVVKNDCLIDFADLTLNLKVLTVLMMTDEGFIRSIEAAGLFKSSLVRHATDAEIKAGKRL